VSGTNGKPIPIHGAPGAWSTPRVCLAGRDRVVIVWRAQSHGQQVLSAISDDGGTSFCIAPLGIESSHGDTVGESADVACAPDGRAVAVWDGEGGVRVAALSGTGVSINMRRGDLVGRVGSDACAVGPVEFNSFCQRDFSETHCKVTSESTPDESMATCSAHPPLVVGTTCGQCSTFRHQRPHPKVHPPTIVAQHNPDRHVSGFVRG